MIFKSEKRLSLLW